MPVFQAQSSGGSGLNLGSLMSAAMANQRQGRSAQDSRDAFNRQLFAQNLRNLQANQRMDRTYGYQDAMLDKRNRYSYDQKDYTDSLIRGRNRDQSLSYYDSLNTIYGNKSPYANIDRDTMANMNPTATRSLASLAMFHHPSEIRKKGTFLWDNVENVPASMRGQGQNAFNYIYGEMSDVGGGQTATYSPAPETNKSLGQAGYETRDPFNPVPENDFDASEYYGMNDEELFPNGYESLVESEEPVAESQEPAYTNEPNADYSNSPFVRKGALSDIRKDTELERATQGKQLRDISDSEQLQGLDGSYLTYSDGQKIPNSPEVEFASDIRSSLLETNDVAGLRALDTEIMESMGTLKQTANAMRTIQDSLLDKDLDSKEARQGLDNMRSTLNADFAKYQELASKDEEAAREYVPQLVNNLRRGFVNQFKFLPVDQSDAQLVSAYEKMTGVIALQVAKELNGGRPSDPDKLGIVDALGGAMNNPNTLFANQGGMFDFLASRTGPKVLATRDKSKIDGFNDVYNTVTGADYDPRGAIYEGIQNKEIRSNHPDFSLNEQGGYGGLTPEEQAELEELEALYGNE